MPNIAYAYGRGSTAKQTLTLDAQKRQCRSYYDSNLADECMWGGFHGELQSGAKDYTDRTLGQLVANMSPGDKLIVAKLDRLGRSTFDLAAILKVLEKANLTLVCLDPMVDTSTSHGRMIFHIMAALAEYERDLISIRIADAHAERRAQGLSHGGPAPYGYRVVYQYDSSGRKKRAPKLVPDHEEREFIANLVQMHAAWKEAKKRERSIKKAQGFRRKKTESFIEYANRRGVRFRGCKLNNATWHYLRKANSLDYPIESVRNL